jgi:phage/plasmid-associated DNA primase
LIPFTTRFDDNPVDLAAGRCKPLDKQMREKLLAELPGILAWAVRGCLAWQQHRSLAAPPEVLAATEEYRCEMDTIQHFLNDWCVEEDGAEVQSSILYDRYRQWAQENGERDVMSNRRFSRKLAERGFTKVRKRAGSVFIGLRVKTLDELEGAQDYPVDAPKPQNTESPGTQDPVDDEEIGTCTCCGRQADRYTPVGEPICSACVDGGKGDDEDDLTDDDFIFGEVE